MAFIDNIVSRTDDDAAAYLAFLAGAATAKTRLVTQRTAVDDIEESAEWESTLAGLTVADRRLAMPSPLAPLGSLNSAVGAIFGSKLLAYDTDVERYAALNGLPAITTLKAYLQYMNYGAGVVSSAAWAYLMAPAFGQLYGVVIGDLGAKLVFAPALSDLGHKAAGGSFVAGADVVGNGALVNGVKIGYDFADGKINTALYAGAAVLNLTSATITGSGVVTVVGDGYGASGVLFTGHAWTLAVSSDTTAPLVPAVPGDILYRVSAINIPAGITVGTLTVKSSPARTNPPV